MLREKAFDSRAMNNTKFPSSINKTKYLPSLTLRGKNCLIGEKEEKNNKIYTKNKNENNDNNCNKDRSFEKDFLNPPMKTKMNLYKTKRSNEGNISLKSINGSFTKTARFINNSNFLIEENSYETSTNFKKINPNEKNGKYFIVFIYNFFV